MSKKSIKSQLLIVESGLLADGSERAELLGVARLEVSRFLDGFEQVLAASKACRDLQNAYFTARKAGLSGHKELKESKNAEKILDNLVKFWTAEMTDTGTEQTSLF